MYSSVATITEPHSKKGLRIVWVVCLWIRAATNFAHLSPFCIFRLHPGFLFRPMYRVCGIPSSLPGCPICLLLFWIFVWHAYSVALVGADPTAPRL